MSYESKLAIISGGQTGADQGALEGALLAGYRTGGYIPKGFKTERGSMPELARFGMVELPIADYVYRTRMNAQASSMTIWFGRTDSSGFYATSNACRSFGKPFYDVTSYSVDDIVKLIIEKDPTILNVAGNRESKSPGIQERVRETMFLVLSKLKRTPIQQSLIRENEPTKPHRPSLKDFGITHTKLESKHTTYMNKDGDFVRKYRNKKKKSVKPKTKRKCRCK
jgi:hypothetical protein